MQISIYTRRGRHRPVKSEKYSADHCVFVVSFFCQLFGGRTGHLRAFRVFTMREKASMDE